MLSVGRASTLLSVLVAIFPCRSAVRLHGEPAPLVERRLVERLQKQNQVYRGVLLDVQGERHSREYSLRVLSAHASL